MGPREIPKRLGLTSQRISRDGQLHGQTAEARRPDDRYRILSRDRGPEPGSVNADASPVRGRDSKRKFVIRGKPRILDASKAHGHRRGTENRILLKAEVRTPGREGEIEAAVRNRQPVHLLEIIEHLSGAAT